MASNRKETLASFGIVVVVVVAIIGAVMYIRHHADKGHSSKPCLNTAVPTKEEK